MDECLEIGVTRRIDAPVDAVWRAFLDEDVFASWFWPRRLEPVYTLEPRVGGRWSVSSPVASMAVGGVFLAIDEPSALSFSWRWEGEPHDSSVSVLLAPAREHTTLVDVTHSWIADETAAADLQQGWNDCLDRLPAALAGH